MIGTLEAGVVKTIELNPRDGWLDPIGHLTISTYADDIWVTTGQRPPWWAVPPAWSHGPRDRRPPADPGPDVPGAHLVTLEHPGTVSWLVDAMNPELKLWSAGTPAFVIVHGWRGRDDVNFEWGAADRPSWSH